MILLHKYYIKKPDDVWVCRDRKNLESYSQEELAILTPWLELLKTLPWFVDFEEEYMDSDTFRYTFKFDVSDDKATEVYNNYIKIMRNTKNPVVKNWDNVVDTKHVSVKNSGFPKRFYQTEDSKGNTTEFLIASI